MHALLEAHALGDSMGIWGWVHATRALEPFVPAGGPVRDLWAVMARHDADTNRNDWLGLADDILSADAAALAQAREDLRACAEALAGCVSEARIARSADEYPESGTPYNIANDCAERISGYRSEERV